MEEQGLCLPKAYGPAGEGGKLFNKKWEQEVVLLGKTAFSVMVPTHTLVTGLGTQVKGW